MNNGYRWYAGIDWGSEKHVVCMVGPDGNVAHERSVAHSGAGLAELVAWLKELSVGDTSCIAVAIETPRGAVVEGLVQAGAHVFAINPKQLDRFRDRHTVAGAKDDRLDAYVLADSLRTDLRCFRRVALDSPGTAKLREWSHVEEEIGVERRRLANRLRDLLQRYYPSLLRLCPAADEPWLWSLLEMAPTPEQGAKLRRVQRIRLLRNHRIRRFTEEELRKHLAEPPLPLAPGSIEAAREHVELLLPRLRLADQQQKHCRKRIERLLDELSSDESQGDRQEHRDVRLLRSLPGLGIQGTATMLSEAWQPLAERDYHTLRVHCGAAPVTKATGKRSGKHAFVIMRRACNHRLRRMLYHWARTASIFDARAKTYYSLKRKQGHTHGRALRGLGDRLLRILIAMLKSGTLYDPNHPRTSEITA